MRFKRETIGLRNAKVADQLLFLRGVNIIRTPV